MTHGAFDLLHPGHVAHLEFAKKQGDRLIVAVSSDDMVRRRKGDARPVHPFAVRRRMLEALACVDECVGVPDVTNHPGADIVAVILRIKPDVFVSSYPNFVTEFGDELRAAGIRFVLSYYTDGISTTETIRKIVESHEKAAA